MEYKKILLLLLLVSVGAAAQVSNPSVQYQTAAPSGACSAAPPIRVVDSTGTIYTCDNGTWAAVSGGGGSSLLSPKVVYVSKLADIPASVPVVPGSSASGTTDSASIIQAAITGGNVDLEVDGGYALSTSLVLSSNTTIHCIAPQYGFIMQVAANTPVLINAHTNAPTTANSTSGFLVSNIGDTNIKVQGCTLNANSTQAVTGTNSLGTAHGATPGGSPTAKAVGGVEFYAINGLIFNGNEVYDSGAWAMFGSNDEYVQIHNNYFHQPTPIVASKNTAGYQFDGPDQFIFASGNRISAGDDSIAYVADDGQYPGTGEAAATYIKSFVKWGNLTDVVDSDEIFDNTFYGVRLLSVTDLMDRIFISNISGTICGNTGTLLAAWPGLGLGNLGTIRFDGWNLATTGTCNTFSLPYNFNVSSNIQSLQLSGIQLTNPGASWPVVTQTAGTIGILSERDWDLNTQTSSFTNVNSFTGGTIGQLAASGINWDDNPGNSGSFFSGSAVPSIITVSNYSGPNRLLASGFAPAIENGDAFTNTYPAVATVYVNTTFTEASAGAALAGTAPATCTNGCTGNWTAAANFPTSNPWQYNTASVIGAGQCIGGASFCPVYINVGHTDYTIRYAFSDTTVPDSFAMQPRFTDANNSVWLGCNTGTGRIDMYDIVSGTANLITSGGSCASGTYSVVMSGTSVTVNTPGGSFTGTVSGSNTGTNVGFANFGSGGTLRITLSAFSVKSS